MRHLALVLMCGCTFGSTVEDGGTTDATPRRDGGLRPDTGMEISDAAQVGQVVVGTGVYMFEPLQADQVMELEAGPQGGGRFGGFHIWFGARIFDLEAEQIMTTFSILGEDRSNLGEITWTTNYRPIEGGTGHEIWGAAPRLMDCCAARGQPLYMRVEVTDTNGISRAHEVRVIGGASCENFTGDVCP